VREKLKYVIGQLMADAGHLSLLPNSPENEALAQEWRVRAYNLILNGLGLGEANLFISDAGYVFHVSNQTLRNSVLLEGRIRRLSELVSRL
jgi:hypothetical protein